MVELRKVDEDNVWKLLKLSVAPGQENFVATNTQSIVQAYTAIASGGYALPFGIYKGDTPVGFVMFGYSAEDEEGAPNICKGNYCIWRFMIDKDYQGQGLGKSALVASLAYVRTLPCGPATHCWLSYEPENAVARALYTSLGFAENGEMCGDEIVSVLAL